MSQNCYLIKKLRILIDLETRKIGGIEEVTNRCLNTERWNRSVPLMILDASFTSTGLNYFKVVVPKLKKLKEQFSETVKDLKSLANFDYTEALHIWRNQRSWSIAKEIAKYLSSISEDDREAFRAWAKTSSLLNWQKDPVGRIKGVGLITYQYLRMMGGIDTTVPDRIVKKVINEMLKTVGQRTIFEDFQFINFIETLSKAIGYSAVQLCFMCWFKENPEAISQMP